MKDNSVSDFPSIKAAYTDELGEVDPEVHKIAQEIWSPAKSFAIRILHDAAKGRDLLLQAVVRVSRVRRLTKIENVRSYLFLTYKRLLLAELKKETGHQRILKEHFTEDDSHIETEDNLNKQILINELRRRMDDWTRNVFDLLSLGYEYKELVPDYGKAANVIRSKYSKKLARLARQIAAEIDEIDNKI